ncbi:hypothetical protein [Peptostreptococcus porci]|uniref:hypothetical protein n=1 Tax=Peptostreptococcus porci TaxID=2652282 RepID=UPI0023F14E2F|nr:hypothetical protein [Peptostreptococcus porci]MDD7182934.1 hypothetical protein [Peptostreptococcus porci]MDY2795074.1 hypothetical protein [Peptostreptococcus porci]MDY4129648.1 hypothetical protein [Peptostreptococcus porci]MDY4560157.1 hypothetical protein [Peptostreptococcus porci]MDY5436745.1 hypothetical protein [Peptostreptococcus porci]
MKKILITCLVVATVVIVAAVSMNVVKNYNNREHGKLVNATTINTQKLFMDEFKKLEVSEKYDKEELLNFIDKMETFYSMLERMNYFDGDIGKEEDDYKKFSNLIIENNALDPSLNNIKINYNEYVIYSVLKKNSNFEVKDIQYLIENFHIVRERLRYLNINEVKDLYNSMIDTHIENQQEKKLFMDKTNKIFDNILMVK